MERILVVVPCGRAKVWDKNPRQGPTPAREAYTGAPFRVNKEYAELFANQWGILSAKFGFIPPDFLIPGPYNVTFKDKRTNPVSVSTLRNQIRAQNLERFDTVIGLGGKEYREMVKEAFAPWPARVSFPFAGLPIGKAMGATKRAIRLRKPSP